MIRKWEPSLRERFRRPLREKREKPLIFARIWPSARRATGDRAREALTAIHHAQHCQPLLPTNQAASVLSVRCILSQSICGLARQVRAEAVDILHQLLTAAGTEG